MSFSTTRPVPGLFLDAIWTCTERTRWREGADEKGKPSTDRAAGVSEPVCAAVVTDRRMMLIGGLLRRTAAATPLDQVTGLTLRRTVLGRLLGYGTLIVVSPSRRQAFRKARYLPYPDQL
jgi:hypothetical protein